MALAKSPGRALVSEFFGDIDNIPKEFRAKIGIRRTDQQNPTDILPDVLVGDVVQSQVVQERTDERKKSTFELIGDIATELDDETFITKSGQIGHKTRSLVPEGTDLIVNEFTEEANQHNLGNGFLDQEVVTVDEVWPDLVSSIEIPDLLPEIFKATLPTFVREFTEAGTIDDPPILPVGDFERTESQLTEFHKRIHSRGREGITYPQGVVVLRHIGGEQFGGAVTQLEGFLDDSEPLVETGVGIVSSEVRNLGNGTWFRQTEKLDADINTTWFTLTGHEFDEEIQGYIDTETQVVDPDYIVVLADYTVENLRPIDFIHSRRIKIDKSAVATHDSPATALISYDYHPFAFPGTLDYNRLITYQHREGYRKASALLTRHTNRRWWLNSDTPPTVGDQDLGTFDVDVKEIITDTVNVPVYSEGNFTQAITFPEVLHDNIINSLGASYPATTPSLTEYYLGVASGSTALYGVGIGANDGSGYVVGDTVTAGGYGFTIVSTGTTGTVGSCAPNPYPPANIIIVGATNIGTFAVSGGSGSGGHVTIIEVTYDIPVAGSMWVGTEKPVRAVIKPTNIPNLWEVMTESVVMR